MPKIRNIQDVSQFQLCSGCGVCAAMEPDRFYIDDVLQYGRRPFLKDGAAEENGDAFSACPGINLKHTFNRQDPKLINNLLEGWGPVYEVMEGYAVDEELRFSGSSGGVVSALALYCLEKGGMDGVLHTAARKDKPYLNETVLSRSREDILASAGSRYSPASPCDKLAEIDEGQEKVAFIGKPCDVAAVQRARKLRSNLDKNIGITISFFCAGVPSTEGSLKLLEREGISDPELISGLRYRGKGWPGLWTAEYAGIDEDKSVRQLSYSDSWGFLQKYRQWRCYVCPDHTGEFADISVGDPWYKKIKPDEAGNSLIVVRTELGEQLIKDAINAGYISIMNRDSSLLLKSQPNLLDARGALWGRLLGLRLAGAAVPKYHGFKMVSFWCSRLNWVEKLKSIVGTVKRVYRKRLLKRV